MNSIDNLSQISINEENFGKILDIACENPSVANLEHPEKGVYFFESKDPIDDEIILLSAGIHGDELAGVKIIDQLRAEILSGSLHLKKHVCFVDGNLKAMEQAMKIGADGSIPESRYWDPDKQYGIEANANRMWNVEDLEKESGYASYAGKRRREIWNALNAILLGGSDTREFSGRLFHTDIHQSFKVPTVKEVRGAYRDDSEYTYGMAYESEVSGSLDLLRNRFSEVYAGLVISDPITAETFAAISSREFGASSVTAELGTIGSADEITYAHKMLEVLRDELQGETKKVCDIAIDIRAQTQTIIRKQEERFGFYDLDGDRIQSIPDFVPTEESILILNGDKTFTAQEKSSFLFANQDVVVGDRAGVIIERGKHL